jgi:hypothetical protein
MSTSLNLFLCLEKTSAIRKAVSSMQTNQDYFIGLTSAYSVLLTAY